LNNYRPSNFHCINNNSIKNAHTNICACVKVLVTTSSWNRTICCRTRKAVIIDHQGFNIHKYVYIHIYGHKSIYVCIITAIAVGELNWYFVSEQIRWAIKSGKIKQMNHFGGYKNKINRLISDLSSIYTGYIVLPIPQFHFAQPHLRFL